MEAYMFLNQTEGKTRRIRPMPQVHYNNYQPQPSLFNVDPPPISREGVIDSSQAAQKYGGFVICDHKSKPSSPQARSQTPRILSQAAKPASPTTLVSYVVKQDKKPRSMMPVSVSHLGNSSGTDADFNAKAVSYVVNQDRKPRPMLPVSYAVPENKVDSVTHLGNSYGTDADLNTKVVSNVVNQDKKPRPVLPVSHVIHQNKVRSISHLGNSSATDADVNTNTVSYVVNQDKKPLPMLPVSHVVPENKVGSSNRISFGTNADVNTKAESYISSVKARLRNEN